MAGNTVSVNLEVTDQGNTLDQRIGKTQQLNRETSKAVELSNKLGRRAAASPDMGDYTRAGGVTGRGGAGARDFANEAQGLGGLVRLYATVAANTYAAAAAFTALKEAANTTNMVKGLDQLGAISGVALGTLSKNFVDATDGAISLREAMQSVAKASAAGLSSAQIIDIGKYAKTASQALGVDMADAVSRLTRGITKLEPELLDELGLFTKIGPATEEYARKVGKTAASLTDFERRQAFANAVLDEAKKKFGDIQLDANPYQKLESSIRNLATAGLELINKVLIPLTNVLASNSGVLAGVLGLIGAKLISSAIPALTSWRNELVLSAKVAKEKAADINESFGDKFVKRIQARLQIPELEKDLQQAERAFQSSKQKFLQEDNNYRQKGRSSVFKALTEEADLNEKIKAIKTEITRKTKENTAESLRHADSLKTVLVAYQKQVDAQTKLSSAQAQAEDKYAATNLEEKARLAISKRAGSRAERLDILSQVGQNVESGGFRYALDELERGLKKAVDLSGWDKLRTKITGVFIAAAASVGVFLRALGGLMNIIGLLTAAYAFFSSILSKNSQETADFNSAIEKSNSSIKTADAVMDKYGKTISTAAINARANIFQQLSDDVEDLANKLEKADKSANWFDRLVDSFKIGLGKVGIGGGGLKQEFAKNVAENWVKQIEQIPEGPIRTALEERLKQITGAASTNLDDLVKAIAGQANEDVTKVVKEANKAFDQQKIRSKQLQAATQGVAEALKDANLRAQDLTQSLAATDPVTKLGASFVTLGIRVVESFKDIESSIASVQDLVKDQKMLQLISPEAYARILDYDKVIGPLGAKIQDYQSKIATAQKALDTLESADMTNATEGARLVVEAEKAKLRKDIGELTVVLEPHQYSFKMLQRDLNNIAVQAIRTGYELINKMAGIAMRQGSIAIQKSLLQGLSGPGIAAATAKLNIEELDLQKEQINITSRLNETMIRNNILAERRLTQDSITKLEDTQKSQEGGLSVEQSQELQFLQNRLRNLELLSGAKIDKATSAALKPGEVVQAVDPVTESFRLQLELGRAGAATQTAGIEAKKAQERINAQIQSQIEIRAEETKALQVSRDRIGLQQQLLDLQQNGLTILNEQQIALKEEKQDAMLIADQELKRRAILDEIASINDRLKFATGETKTALERQKTVKQGYLRDLTEQQKLEDEILTIQQAQARVANYFARINKDRENANDLERLKKQLIEQATDAELEQLDLKSKILGLTDDQILRERVRLEANRATQAASAAEANAEAQRVSAILQLLQQVATTQKAGGTVDVDQVQKDLQTIQDRYFAEIDLIDQTKKAKHSLLLMQATQTTQMQEFTRIAESAFSKFEDAIVQFTKTGKLSFKDMINSFIEDLLRYELKQQRMAFLSSVGGVQGIINAGKALIFGGPTGGSAYNTYVNAGGFAMGAAFNRGIEAYARGGMFTNSVVNQPTLFKAAKGLGVMGEAGPEAIMPLKRDSAGNLGVRGGGGSVEVVVNNYTSERAEARETTDSRGNRRVEVVIGDIVADQMTTNNSSMQQAMLAGYGARPRMIRR